jgi:hypothetical protein
MRMRKCLVLLLLLLAPFVQAQQSFEVVVSGWDIGDACHITPISTPVVQWHNPNALNSDDVVSIATDGRRVYGLINGTPLRVVELRPDGSQIPFYTGTPFGKDIAAASDGRVFVSRGGAPNTLLRISASGVLEATYPVSASDIEVGSDGCTIYYVGPSSSMVIHRMNGCTGAALPDFATTPYVYDFEVLPDGQVLVASETEVRLYDASGSFVRVVGDLDSYGLGGNIADEIAARGGIVYIAAPNWCDAASSVLLRIALSDGAELARTSLRMNSADSIALAASGPTIPTLSEMALALLAFVLAAGGAFMLELR